MGKTELKKWYKNMKERGHLEEAEVDGRHYKMCLKEIR
jgi:hypothetical protein